MSRCQWLHNRETQQTSTTTLLGGQPLAHLTLASRRPKKSTGQGHESMDGDLMQEIRRGTRTSSKARLAKALPAAEEHLSDWIPLFAQPLTME